MKTLLTVVLTLLVSGAAAVAGGLAFMYSGIYDVSALTPDSAMVTWAVHTTSDHSVGARLGGIVVPAGLDQTVLITSGGHLFAQNCAVCHGGPGLAKTDIARGINPQAPDLFRASRVPDAAENFQFVKYGVKMTGMPGFGVSRTDAEIWSLVGFLGAAPGMTAADFTLRTGAMATAGK